MKVALPILPALALAACTALPPGSRMDHAGVPVPTAWSAKPDAIKPVDAAWLKRFHDPRLNALVDEALRNSPDLKIAAARVDQAATGVAIAGSAARPSAQINMAGIRSKRNFIGFPGLGGTGTTAGATGAAASVGAGSRAARAQPAEQSIVSSLSNNFGPSLDIQWELDVWGRVRAGQSAAIAQAQAAEFDFAAARTSLAAQTAKAYFALAEAEEVLALTQETEATYDETEKAIADRFRTGQAEGQMAGAQYRLAKSDTANARAQVQQASEARERARRSMETLLGRYPSGTLKSPVSLPGPPAQPPAGLPSDLLLRRPDLLAAERRFAGQGQRVKEGWRALFPQFKLTASAGTSTSDLQQILNSDFGVWTLAGNIIQPVLTGGRLRSEIHLRQAEEREALARLQKSVLDAFGEVEIALAADAFLAGRESALRDAVQLATEADQEARATFKQGVGDLLTVFASQNRKLQTQAQFISVRRLRLDNRINLHLALGGDFEPRSR